ncbi:response regulator [Alkalihalobacterium chitinilyticum]|uniref:Response regulator transcription factor n=1 Tax=Alkalihalobacterium chitinilyticum TaxID=2980103 RepID=A0ABT5VGL6_9BACI|nr:response regulator transcription factor [Alkalihalobacterium chitinilyticum]MDE5414608.1 response regulator transcription factor [Alkalihalobacterium chitinilyticum]
MYKILLADDHQIVRDGLKLIIGSHGDYTIVGEASNGDELLTKAIDLQPDLVLSDLKMPGRSIIDHCPAIKENNPNVKVMVLTAYDDSEDIYNAIDAEVDGYIMKDTPPEQILNTIQMVLMGITCFQPKVNAKRALDHKDTKNILNLTQREKEIFHSIVDNLSNQEIAAKLFISEATVKTHVSSILRKTGQPNRSQAVLYAIKHNLLEVQL